SRRIWSVIWRTTRLPAISASTATSEMTSDDRAPNGDFSHPGTVSLFPIETRNASCKRLSRRAVARGHVKSPVFGRTAIGHEWSSDRVTFGADDRGNLAPTRRA